MIESEPGPCHAVRPHSFFIGLTATLVSRHVRSMSPVYCFRNLLRLMIFPMFAVGSAATLHVHLSYSHDPALGAPLVVSVDAIQPSSLFVRDTTKPAPQSDVWHCHTN